jgi:carboxyl-terminal processing protease
MNWKQKKIYIIYIMVFAFILALGRYTSFAESNGKENSGPDKWQQELKKYAHIYTAIKNVYPGKVDTEKLFFASINGLLRQLDPHSYFLDPLMVRSLNEDQQGNYYGIGTRITKYEERLTVVAPLAGTPAHKMGVMAGDVIAKIESKDTRHMSLDDAMKLLRGAKDSVVSIEIRRAGITELIPFKIKRAEIPLNSISYSLVLPQAPEIGFISVRTFGNTTADEFKTNVEELKETYHIKGLIVDLRGNAGGSLYAAIDLADFFLEKQKVIVSVKGRTFNRNFEAQENNQYESLPLVVLINRGSASASEIVAAAIQDHKRGEIIGSRSWGKGLVQTISRLSLNSSLALTTAKYYTPDNKCLQRDFDERDDYFFFVNNRNYDTDSSIEGGVIPDIPIKPEYYPEAIVGFVSRGIFFQFARHLVDSKMEITQEFKADDKIIAKFLKFLDNKKMPYKKTTIQKHLQRLRIEIEREVMANKFSPTEGVKVFLKSDKVTQKAVEVLKKKYER